MRIKEEEGGEKRKGSGKEKGGRKKGGERKEGGGEEENGGRGGEERGVGVEGTRRMDGEGRSWIPIPFYSRFWGTWII